MGKHPFSGARIRVLSGVLLAIALTTPISGQSVVPGQNPAGPMASAPVVPASSPSAPSALATPTQAAMTPAGSAAAPRHVALPVTLPRHATAMSAHARDHYQLVWGVDSLDVKAVESGQMIRFSYFVLDPAKAEQLNDKKAIPSLIDQQAGVKLEIPTMEKVGQLRQSAPPEVGKSYWMVFSNKGGLVKPGDRVSVLIGKFKADGLYVR